MTKLTDSAGAQKTPSNSLKQELMKEETGASMNAELANAMVKKSPPEKKLQEQLNK